MRGIGRVVLALLFVATATGVGWAQVQIEEENSGVGTTSAEFLTMGAGARGMALGPAFSSIVRDVESLFYNPAGLPLMEGTQTMFTSMPYFADTDYFWAGFAFPFADGEYGIGLSLSNFGFSEAPVYTEEDPEGASQLTYDVSETVVGLSFAHAFIDRFTGGVTLKFLNDQLGDTNGNGFAADVGTNFHSEIGGKPISFSFVIQNLGPGIKHQGNGLSFTAFPGSDDPDVPVSNVDPSPARFQTQDFPLPTTFRVGVAYDPVRTPQSRLTVLGEFNEASNTDPAWSFGSEFEWSAAEVPFRAALRGSYAFQPDNYLSDAEEDEIGGAGFGDEDREMDGLTLGGGLSYAFGDYEARVDYAYRHFGTLGTVDVFTVGFAWR